MFGISNIANRFETVSNHFRGLGRFFVRRNIPALTVEEKILPQRLTIDEQWSRTISVLQQTQKRTIGVMQLQGDAAAQLDAATYALQRLRDEIRPALMLTQPTKAVANSVTATPLREPFRRRDPIAA